MNSDNLCTRRNLLRTAGAGALALAANHLHADSKSETPAIKGHLKQSVCRWCYSKIPLEKLAAEAKRIGYQSIELLTIDEYKIVKPFGLTCAVLGRVSISEGLNGTQ